MEAACRFRQGIAGNKDLSRKGNRMDMRGWDATPKTVLKRLVGKRLWNVARRAKRRLFGGPDSPEKPYFEYDRGRLARFSGVFATDTHAAALAKLILYYHALEKGLTMPSRRMGFGKDVVRGTMTRVDAYERTFGWDAQSKHAAGVVRAYGELHDRWEGKSEDPAFWREVEDFVSRHANIPSAKQFHWGKSEFFSKRDAPFPVFAASRHCVRDYGPGQISVERIREAVKLAATAPSACNRQYVRVHCVSDKRKIADVLALQNGNRGFGHLADKLLVVTADLAGLDNPGERNDLFTNGGIFLMNLSYALHYHEIAHCILNWSVKPARDLSLRQLLSLAESESVVALLTCGELPPEFDVAASPRKDVDDIFVKED